MVFLGSSLRANAHDIREDKRNQKGQSAITPRGVSRKHFELIFLGEVR
jgi:hypothetical protein